MEEMLHIRFSGKFLVTISKAGYKKKLLSWNVLKLKTSASQHTLKERINKPRLGENIFEICISQRFLSKIYKELKFSNKEADVSVNAGGNSEQIPH